MHSFLQLPKRVPRAVSDLAVPGVVTLVLAAFFLAALSPAVLSAPTEEALGFEAPGPTAGASGGTGGAVSFRVASWLEAESTLAAAASHGEIVRGPLSRLGIYRLRLPEVESPGEAEGVRRALADLPRVEWAEVEPVVRSAAAPNDPRFWDQYALLRMQVAAAWEWEPGSSSVVVAVVDSGVGPHPDLTGRILPGRNFLDGASPSFTEDTNGHGTAVAGLIAAQVHNREGVAGIAQRVRILPVVALSAAGTGTAGEVAAGIVWAVEQGAQVVNVSLGSRDPSSALQAAVGFARREGTVVVAAAGNDAGQGVRYPAAYPEVIAVAATNEEDGPLEHSNRGPQVDISAPGRGVLSTELSGIDLDVPGYRAFDGTSFSSAYAAGAAALVLSLRHDLSPADVAEILESSAVDVAEPGRDEGTGAGRIDLARAIARTKGIPMPGDVTAPRRPTSVEAELEVDGTVRVGVTPAEARDEESARIHLRRTQARPARSLEDGVGVGERPAGQETLVFTDGPADGDQPTDARYYTAFAVDGAGNVSNAAWDVVVPIDSEDTDPSSPGPSPPGGPGSGGAGFSDVPADHVFADAIRDLAAEGIVSGFADGTFRPNAPVTRAQFAKMVVGVAGLDPADADTILSPSFGDLPAGVTYPTAFVEAAARAGIVHGLASGSSAGSSGEPLFGPYRPIARIQVARMVSRAGGEKMDRPPAGIVLPFYDVSEGIGELEPTWEMGVVRGVDPTTFKPWSGATRGQAAAMLGRLFTVLEERP